MEIAYITLETLSPVIVTAPGSSQILTECSDAFSGMVLRGVLAEEYIKKHELRAFAHEDEGFQHYFFGGLRFIAAHLCVDGHRVAAIPLSIMKLKEEGKAVKKEKSLGLDIKPAKKKKKKKKKNGNGDAPAAPQQPAFGNPQKPIVDLLQEHSGAGYKSLKGTAWIDGDEQIHTATAKRSMEFHMSRSSDDERLGGHSQDGQVYTYEAIDKGQVFQGAVVGSHDLLQAFVDEFDTKSKPLYCRIGRSKYTQYGECLITISKPQALPDWSAEEETYILLDSPLIDAEMAIQAQDVIQRNIIDRLNEATGTEDFSVGKVFSMSQDIESFVGVWGMRRPRQRALAAGSVFELQKATPWSADDSRLLQELAYDGVGLRTEEGFGQLRLWQHTELAMAPEEKPAQAEPQQAAPMTITSQAVKRVAKQVLQQRIEEQVRMFAYDDAQQLHGRESLTHTLARLESWLGDRLQLAGKRGAFLNRLEAEKREGSPLERHLHTIRIQNQSLYDILTNGQQGMPYDTAARRKKLDDMVPPDLAELIGFTRDDDKLFYEYWLWLFRHGRKKSVQLQKEGREG